LILSAVKLVIGAPISLLFSGKRYSPAVADKQLVTSAAPPQPAGRIPAGRPEQPCWVSSSPISPAGITILDGKRISYGSR